mgnify:CR=1 FL=1|tara:strand:- start:28846 stop:30483 length:1638 start_codon:yes stop_codon:yes gene_type:complete
MKINFKIFLVLVLIYYPLSAATYYLDPELGDDTNSGTSIGSSWRTLEKLNTIQFIPGDTIALAAGKTFLGTLKLVNMKGSNDAPIVITSFNPQLHRPIYNAIIDAKGMESGVYLENVSHILLENITIHANAGATETSENSVYKMRCGVLYTNTENGDFENITLNNLIISDIFYEKKGFKRPEKEVKTANGTQYYGWGIRFINNNKAARIKNITIKNTSVENVSHTGIKFTGGSGTISDVRLIDNVVTKAGGPGLQFSGVKNAYIARNTVNGSGSWDDSRKWGRGSGMWTWNSSDFLIEKNTFLNANGPGDSAGIHIDFYCSDIVVQYNLSANNAGGFCEILGDNYNCSYRYNISINDGYRKKGENNAFQEGKIFWLSGYRGDRERNGPFNSYFYNNTIYVKKGNEPKIAIDHKAKGILIANNIFYVEEKIKTVLGDQYKPETNGENEINTVIFSNNLFLHKNSWPKSAPIQPDDYLVGDAKFVNKRGSSITDFIPKNELLIKDRGRYIEKLPGDSKGLKVGLKVSHDILGNPIKGKPDIGAIELD